MPYVSDDTFESNGKFKLALPAGGLHQAFVQFEKKQYPNAVFNVNWTDSWESAVKMVIDGLADATFHDEPIVQVRMQQMKSMKSCSNTLTRITLFVRGSTVK